MSWKDQVSTRGRRVNHRAGPRPRTHRACVRVTWGKPILSSSTGIPGIDPQIDTGTKNHFQTGENIGFPARCRTTHQLGSVLIKKQPMSIVLGNYSIGIWQGPQILPNQSQLSMFKLSGKMD